VRAYRVVEPGRCAFVELAVPVAQPGEVVLRTAAVGLCHSDVFIRSALPSLGMKLPVTLGHEIVGEVHEVGPGVEGLTVGQLVAVYVLVGCRICPACIRDADHLCRTGYRGIGTHLDGGLADFVKVPARNVVDATGLDPIAAAPLTDAGLTSHHAVSTALAAAPHAAWALVIGVGGLGHLGLQSLLAAGQHVIAVDVDEAKVELARGLGAHHVVQSGPGAAANVMALVGGRNIDVVVDFVGLDETLAVAQAVTNRGSAISIAGLGGGRLTVEALSVTSLSPEITVRRVSAGSLADLRQVLALGQERKLEAHTETFSFDDVPDALDRLEAGDIVGRAVIRM
jgi:alcohol dehydrogenase, propanol-preferring